MTLIEILDQMVERVVDGSDGRFTAHQARSTLVQQVVSWYAEREATP